MKAPPATLFVLPLVLVTVHAAVSPRVLPSAQIVDRDTSRTTIGDASTTKVAETTEQSPSWDDEQRAPGVAVASNCSRCRVREEVINLTKEAIKQQILSKLGLQQAPNLTGKALPRIPPINKLLDTYGMQADSPANAFSPGPVYEETEDDYHARTELILLMGKEPPSEWDFAPDLHVQYFPLQSSGVTESERVLEARLWFYLMPSIISENKHINVLVHHVQTGDNLRPVFSHFLTTNAVVKKPGLWVSVEIEKLVEDWIKHPGRNRGLVIEAFDKNGKNLVNVDHSIANGTLVPYVEIRTVEEKKKRRKRMIGLNCEENSNELRCCRYPLTVDFEEFGWDWIIAPKKYEANYCSGECPFVFLQKYPHTHLVQQSNRSGPAGPCCAPRKMSSISMLYFDEHNNIIYGLLPGMVVDRCGCT